MKNFQITDSLRNQICANRICLSRFYQIHKKKQIRELYKEILN